MAEIENAVLIPLVSKKGPKKEETEKERLIREDRGEPWDSDLVGWTEGMMKLEAERYSTFAKELEGATTLAEMFARWEQWKKQKLERKRNWTRQLLHLTSKIGELMKQKYNEEQYVEGWETHNYPEGDARISWVWKK
jgi:hypothetical protein